MHQRRATQLLPYNTGSQQGPSSQRSHNISRRPDTMSFALLRSSQNRRRHALQTRHFKHNLRPTPRDKYSKILVTRLIDVNIYGTNDTPNP